MTPLEITGQLNAEERRILTSAISGAGVKPRVVLEVGTWLGGGSTLHFLRALHENGERHLWGVEADRSIYDRMIENIRAAAPEAVDRFTPLFGFSQEVLPRWLTELGPETKVDVVFLDGGDNPMEQITEFQMLAVLSVRRSPAGFPATARARRTRRVSCARDTIPRSLRSGMRRSTAKCWRRVAVLPDCLPRKLRFLCHPFSTPPAHCSSLPENPSFKCL